MYKSIMTFLFLALFSVTGFAAKTVEVYITNKAAPRLNSEAYLIPQNILVGSKLNIEILMTEVYTFTVNDDVEEIRIRNTPMGHERLGGCSKTIELVAPTTRVSITSTSPQDLHMCSVEYL